MYDRADAIKNSVASLGIYDLAVAIEGGDVETVSQTAGVVAAGNLAAAKIAPSSGGAARSAAARRVDSATSAPDVRTLTPVADPAPPVYEVGHPGKLVVDHIVPRAAGGHLTSPGNLRTIPYEMNARKGAYEGNLLKYERELMRGGMTAEQARAVTAGEWQALQRDALPRSMDPHLLDRISTPCR